MDSLGPISRKHQDWVDENDEEIQGLLEEKHQKHKAYLSDTSTVSNKASYSRQPRLGSEICKTPGWAVRLMKSSPLQIERYEEVLWCAKDSFWSPGTTLFSVQLELVFWLTKKLSWKDGLSTLIVFLIGHHLSLMMLSTDYYRWNVICYLTSSQPSLKQWKQ